MDAVFSVQDDEFDLLDEDDLVDFGCHVEKASRITGSQHKHMNTSSLSSTKENVNKMLKSPVTGPTSSSRDCLLADNCRTPNVGTTQRITPSSTSAGSATRRASDVCVTDDCTPARKRRFPGPAGVLPVLKSLPDVTNVMPSPGQRKSSASVSPKIQTELDPNEDSSDFGKSVWITLTDSIRRISGLPKYDIATVLAKASENSLANGKVPLLAALLKAFTFTGCDAIALLKDPTGEIRGTVHKAVLEKHQADLMPGAGLILRQISVFSPNAKRHYLNITPSNIATVIPASGKENVSISHDLQEGSSEDLFAQNSTSLSSNPSPVNESPLQKDNGQCNLNTAVRNTGKQPAPALSNLDSISDDFLAELDDDADFLFDDAFDIT